MRSVLHAAILGDIVSQWTHKQHFQVSLMKSQAIPKGNKHDSNQVPQKGMHFQKGLNHSCREKGEIVLDHNNYKTWNLCVCYGGFCKGSKLFVGDSWLSNCHCLNVISRNPNTIRHIIIELIGFIQICLLSAAKTLSSFTDNWTNMWSIVAVIRNAPNPPPWEMTWLPESEFNAGRLLHFTILLFTKEFIQCDNKWHHPLPVFICSFLGAQSPPKYVSWGPL